MATAPRYLGRFHDWGGETTTDAGRKRIKLTHAGDGATLGQLNGSINPHEEIRSRQYLDVLVLHQVEQMPVCRYNQIGASNKRTLNEFVVVWVCDHRFYLPSNLYTAGGSA